MKRLVARSGLILGRQRSDVLADLRRTNGWDFSAHREIIRSLKDSRQLKLIGQIARDESMHPAVRDYARLALQRGRENRGEMLLVEPVFHGIIPSQEARVRSSLERV